MKYVYFIHIFGHFSARGKGSWFGRSWRWSWTNKLAADVRTTFTWSNQAVQTGREPPGCLRFSWHVWCWIKPSILKAWLGSGPLLERGGRGARWQRWWRTYVCSSSNESLRDNAHLLAWADCRCTLAECDGGQRGETALDSLKCKMPTQSLSSSLGRNQFRN